QPVLHEEVVVARGTDVDLLHLEPGLCEGLPRREDVRRAPHLGGPLGGTHRPRPDGDGSRHEEDADPQAWVTPPGPAQSACGSLGHRRSPVCGPSHPAGPAAGPCPPSTGRGTEPCEPAYIHSLSHRTA